MFNDQVPADKAFFVSNGHVLRSLADFEKELETITEKDFACHVTKEKNDFYNWIKLVLNDTKLASMIKRVKAKGTVLKKLRLRKKMLEGKGAK